MTQRRYSIRTPRENGFTLVELLVVVAIIGVLVALGLPQFLNARHAATERAAETHAYNTYVALTAYLASNPDADALPEDEESCVDGWTSPDGLYSTTAPADSIPYDETDGCVVSYDPSIGPSVTAWIQINSRPRLDFSFGE